MAAVLTTGASGCVTPTLATPSALIIEKPPILLTVDKMEADYSRDPVAADALYAGKRVYFKQVQVDIANVIGNAARSTEDSLVAGRIKFIPRYPSDMENVSEGAVVDLIGRVQGYLWGYVVITDCWINLTATGGPPPPMY